MAESASSPHATRVQSLFHLVKDGSSAQIRVNAAERLGEVAIQSPQYCRAILQQIRVLVADEDWDVRLAAAACVGTIAKALQTDELHHLIPFRLAQVSFAGREASCPLLNCRSVNITEVLREGAPLLRSGGEEYQYQTNLSEEERRLLVVKQRRLLLRRICGGTDAIWKTREDELTQQMLPRLNVEHVKELADDIEQSEDSTIKEESMGDQTVRKRKLAGELLPEQTHKKSKTVVTDIDHAEDEEETHLDLLALFVVDLLECIFDSKWHVRHGALVTLRHILLSSGFISAVQKTKQKTGDAHTAVIGQWLEESLMRCVCVLALDQFVDYSADGSVAPVRELCAQVFGVFLGSLQSEGLLRDYLGVLRVLLRGSSWHASHGGLLGLKYLIQAHTLHAEAFVPLIMDDVLHAFHQRSDAEEDVKVVATGMLGDFTQYLGQTSKEAIVSGGSTLWQALAEANSSGMVSAAAINSLSQWYSHTPVREILHIELSQNVVADNITHIVPLLHHTTSSVRRATAACITAMFIDDRVFSRSVKASITSILGYMLPHMLLQLLREEYSIVRGSILSGWKAMVSTGASTGNLERCIEMQLPIWLRLLWSFDGIGSLNVDLNSSGPQQEIVVSSVAKENMAARIAFSDAIGYLAALLPVSSVSYNATASELIRGLKSRRGDHQCGALLAIARWAYYVKQQANVQATVDLRAHFSDSIESLANNDWIPPTDGNTAGEDFFYGEHLSSLTRVKKMQARLVEIFASAGVNVSPADVTPSTLFIATQSRSIAEHVAEFPYENLKTGADAFEQAHFRRQDLFLIDEVIQQGSSKLYARIQGLGCAAFCQLLPIPAKKSGFLVKALMEAIKTEENSDFRQLAASTLAEFVLSQANIQRKCVSKIIFNLCNSACALAFREEQATSTEIQTTVTPEALKTVQTRVHGAEKAIQTICSQCPGGVDVLELCPTLENGITRGWEGGAATDQSVQQSMHLVRVLAPTLPSASKRRSLAWMSTLTTLLNRTFEFVRTRQTVAEAIAALCMAVENELREELMLVLYQRVFYSGDEVSGSSEDAERANLGATMVLDQLVSALGDHMTPYVPSLVDYAMKMMNAQNEQVRLLAARAFANLVPLLPLQMDLSQVRSVQSAALRHILTQNEISRGFLEGLLQGKAIQPVDVGGVLASHVALRGYQQRGVDWLAFLMENHLGGILADDMGLGKTLQVLAAIAYRRKSTKAAELKPVLIIAPPIVVHHWITEASRCFPGVFTDVVDYSGPVNERKKLRQQAQRDGGWASSNPNVPTLVISTYSVIRSEAELWSTLALDMVVLDEAHLIRNPKSALFEAVRRLKASHRFALSGTPLQNNVGDLWSLFEFLMPGYLGDFPDFRRDYVLPISRSRERNATSKQKEVAALAINQLHQRVLPFILRRTKMQVLKELPPKIISNVLLPLSPLQDRLYKAATAFKDESGGGKALTGVLKNLQLLKKICVHPGLVRNEVITHGFSAKDIKAMADWKQSGKMAGLRDLLVESCDMSSDPSADDERSEVETHRCLIFAHFKETLDTIEGMFAQALPYLSYRRLDGTTPAKTRASTIQAFNDDPSIDVLLLTTAVGGLGLTLTGADTVIFVEHSWNPFVDLQAMDRAHRIGQRKTVRVFRLIMQGSLEEHIVDLQVFKEKVASTVVSSTDASASMNANTAQVLGLLQESSTAVKAQEAAAAALEAERNRNKVGEEAAVALQSLASSGAAALLDQLGDLWDETQYDSLQFPTIE
ncbi:hypothetical protein Poli38472_002886 [Pythium oligandrum]|uniref:Uncharacterized protein n=1 Tax=Pythium oligandrum TaxID=41045 RepID=A0A8K1C5I5_PYTOL|nr:hypothetical protein Poli38472_002886 [Pythium oligandrum]|eukprot:TMW56961.1 hypothetical protein Poli38472_002886 [Pythium oligandrum]